MDLLSSLQAENIRLTQENEDLRAERETLMRRIVYWTSQAMDTSDSRLRSEQLHWTGRFAGEVMRCLLKHRAFDGDARGWDAYDRLAICLGLVTAPRENEQLVQFQRIAAKLWAAGYSVERAAQASDTELNSVPSLGKKSIAFFRDYAPRWMRDHNINWG